MDLTNKDDEEMDTALVGALQPDVILQTASLPDDTSEEDVNVELGSPSTESSSSIGAGEPEPLFGSIEGIEPLDAASQLPYPSTQTLTMTQLENDDAEEEGENNSQTSNDQVFSR